MPNSLPANLTNLTVDATDVQRANLSLHLDVVAGLSDGKRVRGVDTVIPSLSGRVARNRKGDGRDILLAGWIQGTGSSEADRLASYQNLRDEVATIFDPEGDPVTIVGEALDGTWREIDARAVTIAWNESPVMGVGQLSIAMDAVDSEWQVTGGGS